MTPDPEFDSLLPAREIGRREFVAAGLGAGFALAVQPVAAQTAIVTGSEGLNAGEVAVAAADGPMAAYRATPKDVPRPPVILVVSEIFGVHEHIRDICRRLARAGYYAIAPDLFRRQGDPARIASIPEILSTIVARTPDAEVMADLDAAAAHAAKEGGDLKRLGITGFCWGGRIVWLYSAYNPALKAGVAWYGRLVGDRNALTPKQPADLADALRAPVLGLYGGQDAGIPRSTVEAMAQALKQGGPAAQASRIHIYDEAGHAFNADYRPSYRPAEAADAWRRMLAWFAGHGL